MKSKADKTTHSSPVKEQKDFLSGRQQADPFIPPSVQTKLTVNTPGDPLEQEADATADQVVKGGANINRKEEKSLQRQEDREEEEVQRQEEEEEMIQRQEEEEEEVQRQEEEEEMIQRQEEEEEEVQRQEEEEEGIQRQEEEEEEVQRQEEEEEGIQRSCAECQEENLQLSEAGSRTKAGSIAPPIVGKVLSSPGQPMEKSTQGFMENRFGTDFSQVRIHKDDQAQESAKSISAQAYTYGSDIVFARGKYDTQSNSGRHLLAHELTHVMQQGGDIKRRVDPEQNRSTEQANAPIAPEAQNPQPITGTTSSPQQTPAGTNGTAPLETPIEAVAEGPPLASEIVLEPIMPPPPETLGPEASERLNQSQRNTRTAASKNADLPESGEFSQGARDGVNEPVSETDARAGGELTATLSDRLAPSPEIEELCENIRRVIREKRPPDEDSLLQADPEEAANEAGSQLNDNIDSDVERVEGEYDELDQSPTGTPEQVAEEIQLPPEEVGEPGINAAGAAPDPLTGEEVSLDADAEASAQQMEEAGMSTAVADVVEDGPLAEARATQGELEETAAEDPALVLQEQDEALGNARTDMEALQERALQALESSRAGTVRDSGGQQTDMVQSEENQRDAIGTQAEEIFTNAQGQVNELLAPLTDTAMQMWEAGKARIATEFEQHLARVQSWVDDRHSGFGGGLVELWDDLTGLPDWVTDEYDDAERTFGDDVCDLIREISLYVNGIIVTCEEIINNANEQINTLFDNAPEELAEWAEAERLRFQGRLDGLREEVTNTQQNFNRDLANRAAEAVQEVRQQVHALREAAKGLLGRIADAIAEFLEDPLRAIINGLLRLVGIDPGAFWALVARIEQVISDIVDDPLGFASNLLEAISAGFQKFFDNFFSHLFDGFINWVFSGLGAVGIEIPQDFSLSSIITFFLQLMGITWERIRMLLARHIGEENVALLEQAYGIITDLIELGPRGVFELIKDQLDPQRILDQVIEMAVNFVIETLVQQATIRIIALFNPVGAIVQAIEAIYKVLKWIFENAARIFTLVETVVNGIADIIAGNIAGMAATVENALAQLLVPVIDFIAGFMGLGDLPEKVADMVRGLQNWVEGILDRVIGWLAQQARNILSALGIREDADPEAENEGSEEGLDDSEVGDEIQFNADGDRHRLWVRVTGNEVELYIASENPMSIENKLREWEGQLNNLEEDDQNRARSLIGAVRSQNENVEEEGEQAVRAIEEARENPDPESIAQAQSEDNQVEQAQRGMTDELVQLFLLFEGELPPPEWLDHRQNFTSIDEEAHSLYFEQDNDEIKLIRASDVPTEIGAYLDTLSYDDEDERTGKLASAKSIANEIQLMTRTPTSGQSATDRPEENEIVQKISQLSRLLTELIEPDEEVELPASADWSQRSNNSPNEHYSRVYFLSSRTATDGGGASGTSPEYEFTVGNSWVRMHLLPYSIGGHGGPENWVAAPSNVNSGGPVRSFEDAMETLVRSEAIPAGPSRRARDAREEQPSVLWAETRVTGFRNPITDSSDREMHFASGVELKFGMYRPENGNWVRVNAPLSNQNVSIPPPEDNKIRLSSSSGTAMSASGLDHLTGEEYSTRLINLIKQTRQSGFGSYDILENRLIAATERSRLLDTEKIRIIVESFKAEPIIVLK